MLKETNIGLPGHKVNPELVRAILRGDTIGRLMNEAGIMARRRQIGWDRNTPARFAYPRDVYVEQKLAALLSASFLLSDDNYLMNANHWDATSLEAFKILIPIMISTATPVLWRYDLIQICRAGAEEFIGEPPDVTKLDPPAQFWFPDRDLTMLEEVKREEGFPYPELEWSNDWMVIAYNRHPAIDLEKSRLVAQKLFKTTAFYERPSFILMQHCVIPDHVRIPNGISNEKDIQRLRFGVIPIDVPLDRNGAFLMATCAFMHEKIVSVETCRPSSGELKQITKEKRNPWEVKVVNLRRYEGARTKCGNPVDWNCQWIVQGHWRKQWHPSTETHVPTFIHEYVKGPEDKPLKVPTSTIFKVIR